MSAPKQLETKWTEGPWSASWDDIPHSEIGEGWVVDAPDGSVCVMDGPQDSNEANARLIACAPEMAEALRAIIERYVDLVNCGDCGFWNPEEEEPVIACRAILAKIGAQS